MIPFIPPPNSPLPKKFSELTHLDSVLPLREVQSLLALLDSLESRLVLGQPPPDSPGLLGAEVERQVFLALVEDAELLALSGVDDSQDTGDRLADSWL